ncbi:GNAT family N-acetyltransferase [Paenibacillus glufosinatiresistens]|uniref:GNAT family N-acetyltransferase n=1 Tax=Paenibacillus glufosinatiresistens TaxID=3070657 RepID=UPI00286E1766|nr:GNAT family protein [Paenibacillus sp. YX.27]
MTVPAGSEAFDPKWLSFPDSFETNRLLIRAPRTGDGADLCAAIRESLEELRPWMAFAQTEPDPKSSEKVTRLGRDEFKQRTDLPLRLYDRETGGFVGCSGLHRIDWSLRRFEIGYWIRTSCAGMGYMTEAVNGIVDWAVAELGANRLEIRCSGRNRRSAAVAERCGFVLEGVLRRNQKSPAGGWEDTRIYAKVRGAEFG